jgi:hypothetical protein
MYVAICRDHGVKISFDPGIVCLDAFEMASLGKEILVLENLEKISFTTEDGTNEDYYVLETVKLGGVQYLLVCDELQEDGEALILKAAGEESEGDTFTLYTSVMDEEELRAVADVFECMVDDLTLE